MSYSPKVHYILEKDLDYEIKYETPPSSGISVGDTFGFPISDFEYNGKKYTEYEISQIQRKMEREIRSAKREKVAYMTAVTESDGELKAVMEDALKYANSLVKVKQAKMRDFISQTGQQRQYFREQNYGRVSYSSYDEGLFDRIKNKFNKQNNLTSADNSGNIKSLDIDDLEIMADSRKMDKRALKIIGDTIKKYEKDSRMYISDFYYGSLKKTGEGTPLLQIEPIADKTLRLNINTDIFYTCSLDEINEKLANSTKILAKNLEEAVIHECGHAKSLYGLNISEIKKLYIELSEIHFDGISKIAYDDGAECLAEIEILLSRGEQLSNEVMSFYNKYMKKVKK